VPEVAAVVAAEVRRWCRRESIQSDFRSMEEASKRKSPCGEIRTNDDPLAHYKTLIRPAGFGVGTESTD